MSNHTVTNDAYYMGIKYTIDGMDGMGTAFGCLSSASILLKDLGWDLTQRNTERLADVLFTYRVISANVCEFPDEELDGIDYKAWVYCLHDYHYCHWCIKVNTPGEHYFHCPLKYHTLEELSKKTMSGLEYQDLWYDIDFPPLSKHRVSVNRGPREGSSEGSERKEGSSEGSEDSAGVRV